MRRFAPSLFAAMLAVAGMSLFAGSAQAQYGHNHQRYQHHQFHNDLNFRQYQRYQYHNYAHQFPMNWRQHDRLHDNLNHDAYHDRLEHRQYHRQQQYYYPQYYYPQQPGFNFGFQNRNFSIQFGR